MPNVFMRRIGESNTFNNIYLIISMSVSDLRKSLQEEKTKVHQGRAAMRKDVAVKDRSPDFEAESNRGTIRLADYHGKKNVLLAFYYKNFTGG